MTSRDKASEITHASSRAPWPPSSGCSVAPRRSRMLEENFATAAAARVAASASAATPAVLTVA
eukprot:scaffold122553_cov39-Phaeocystis_antarctica.AAC.3